MSAQARELSETLRELLPRADALAAAVDRAVKKWDVEDFGCCHFTHSSGKILKTSDLRF